MRKLHTMLAFSGVNLFPAMTTVKPNAHGSPYATSGGSSRASHFRPIVSYLVFYSDSC